MPKPLGIAFTLRDSLPSLIVTKGSVAENLVYDAVENAFCENMTVKDFLSIVREAWAHENDQKTKADDDEFKRSMK